MAQIVGVHGIGWAFSSRSQMTETWLAALRTGLQNDRHPQADTVSFEAAFYGSHYNLGSGGKSAGEPLYRPADLLPGFELDLLEGLADAVKPDSGADPQEPGAKGVMVRSPQLLLNILLGVPFFGSLGASGIIRLIKQVHRYFSDDDLRAAVRGEVAAAVKSDTRVIVAHSLGSVAAYETLWEHPGRRIDTLVTIGSPLGIKAVRKRLDVTGDGHPGLPPAVRRWVNVAAEQDFIALEKHLKRRYGGAVEDFVVRNPMLECHDSTWYLQNLRTVRAVGAALG